MDISKAIMFVFRITSQYYKAELKKLYYFNLLSVNMVCYHLYYFLNIHFQDSRRHPLESAKDRRKTNNFSIKPVYCAQSKPLLVFINPRSGGHLGSKLYEMFCWLLNPRQVFNLLDSDPSFG